MHFIYCYDKKPVIYSILQRIWSFKKKFKTEFIEELFALKLWRIDWILVLQSI